MPERLVLQITGQPGAGKTEACRYLTENYGFTSILVSDLIREYANPRGIILRERADYKFAHSELLRELGQQAISEAVLNTPTDLVCVDGIRVPAHAERLHWYGKIIALHCPPVIRFERANQRKGELDKASYEDFLGDEELESRNPDEFVQGTLTVMEMADYDIDSSQPLPQVLDKLDAFIIPLL